ncbi:MAG: DUF2634 domain-containing protein [Clostridia bacterium]|nr:DUF2634 domain-containing protein [Clostridia bacterium]
MALPALDYELYQEYKIKSMPGKTWKIDLEKGRIKSEQIDGDEAILQAVKLILMTARGTSEIYSENYGTDELLRIDRSIFEIELQNNIIEAIKQDDRISGADGFVFSYPEKNKCLVSFNIIKEDGGTIESEEEMDVPY